jgi:hypothetical protein
LVRTKTGEGRWAELVHVLDKSALF